MAAADDVLALLTEIKTALANPAKNETDLTKAAVGDEPRMSIEDSALYKILSSKVDGRDAFYYQAGKPSDAGQKKAAEDAAAESANRIPGPDALHRRILELAQYHKGIRDPQNFVAEKIRAYVKARDLARNLRSAYVKRYMDIGMSRAQAEQAAMATTDPIIRSEMAIIESFYPQKISDLSGSLAYLTNNPQAQLQSAMGANY